MRGRFAADYFSYPSPAGKWNAEPAIYHKTSEKTRPNVTRRLEKLAH